MAPILLTQMDSCLRRNDARRLEPISKSSSLNGNGQGATVPPLEDSAAWTARTLRDRLAPELAAALAALTAASDSRCHQDAAASVERWATPP